MKHFELILQFPTGGVLIGGYSPVPDGLHAAHAVDRNGRPILPSTAVRGALRETFESLLRGAGDHACSGGDGVEPAATLAATTPIPCTLDAGHRCKACRLFGSHRTALDEGERDFSALVLGDAHLENDEAMAWTVRPGVGIARSRRSVEDKRLFLSRTPATPGLRFTARGRLLDPDLARYFNAVARATKHLGGGRSRGLARVEIQLRWHESTEAEAVPLPHEGDVRLRVTLRSPASIGVPIVHPNLRETRLELPGAAVRGAIGFALAEVLESPNQDEPFQELVAEDGAGFGFLHPVDDTDRTEGPSAPLPITTVACKREGRAHGTADTLMDRLTMALVTEVSQVDRVEELALSDCPTCHQPLRALGGWRRRTSPVPTRTVTRVSMDRAHASARERHLFSQVLLEAGTVFEGVIRHVPARGKDHLARALTLPLSIGRGKSSGWGLIQIEVLPPITLAPLDQRASDFERALQGHLEQAHLRVDRAGRLVPITLLSPLLAGGEDDGEVLLSMALGGASCLLKARRFSREGGWDQRGRGMQPALATAAGGVFVFDLGPDRTWRDVLTQIGRLEQRGVGDRCHQGYGQVVAFDSMFLQRTFRGEPNGSSRQA
jgi:CRISPR/Cas system CSM-associated protein Csm3 (group 7 of RAMP superfamily)